jgi:NADH-quinone oxidoreductase subunit J
MELIIFILLSLVCLGSAVSILVQRHPIYSALSLVLTLISLAGIYIQMHAEFIAVMQIVVYAGAIMVLFVFVVMLLNVKAEEKIPKQLTFLKYLGIPLVVLLLGTVGLKVVESLSGASIPVSHVVDVSWSTRAIGTLLYTQYALPFEVTSLLLLVAIVGAIIMAKKEL